MTMNMNKREYEKEAFRKWLIERMGLKHCYTEWDSIHPKLKIKWD